MKIISLLVFIVLVGAGYFLFSSGSSLPRQSNIQPDTPGETIAIAGTQSSNNTEVESTESGMIHASSSTPTSALTDPENSTQRASESDTNNFAKDLLDVFGEDGFVPVTDKSAQERLLEKIRSEDSNAIDKKYKEGEYDPKYDATWHSDMQTKAAQELENFFPEDAFIEDYNCDNQIKCQVKISKLNSSKRMTLEAVDYIDSLRNTPAILQSGQTRDVYLSYIGPDENGNSIVKIDIGQSNSYPADNDKTDNTVKQ